jgi:two-component system, OmpR family, phosphate regulon sensor histidine kinase PhoR
MENKGNNRTDSFIAITHHVRGPIYVLKGYLEALSTEDFGELNGKQKKYIDVCLENVERASQIMGNLISVIEIEEGKYEIQKEMVDMVKITEEAIESSRYLAAATNTKISFISEKDAFHILTDSVKFRKVIDTFINNAIKYKNIGEGKIEIKIEESNGKAIFSIKDNGIGVNEEEKERIFNKFYRTKEAIEIDPNELGLELYINKIIIEKCGGEVWVENNENGKGSTFYFTALLEDNKE